MGESATDAIYIGTYVLIFIIAISITIILFTGIVDYADKSYEYGQNQTDSTISTNGATTYQKTEEDKVYLTADEVVSYYYNYIEKDLYADASSGNSDVEYIVTIVYDNSDPKGYYKNLVKDTNSDVQLASSYKDLIKKLGNGKYALEYNTKNDWDKQNIEVTIDIKRVE